MRKEYDFSRLRKAEPKYLRRTKAAVTMRLDPTVIAYFRSLASDIGMPYQSLINYVLKEYANHGLEPSANWSSSRRKRTGVHR
jgi:predicted DNA binding CopG/RHH family protein